MHTIPRIVTVQSWYLRFWFCKNVNCVHIVDHGSSSSNSQYFWNDNFRHLLLTSSFQTLFPVHFISSFLYESHASFFFNISFFPLFSKIFNFLVLYFDTLECLSKYSFFWKSNFKMHLLEFVEWTKCAKFDRILKIQFSILIFTLSWKKEEKVKHESLYREFLGFAQNVLSSLFRCVFRFLHIAVSIQIEIMHWRKSGRLSSVYDFSTMSRYVLNIARIFSVKSSHTIYIRLSERIHCLCLGYFFGSFVHSSNFKCYPILFVNEVSQFYGANVVTVVRNIMCHIHNTHTKSLLHVFPAVAHIAYIYM